MKAQRWVMAVMMVLAVLVMPAPLVQGGNLTFSGSGSSVSNGTHNVSWYVISAAGDRFGRGIPRIEYLHVNSDVSTAALGIWEPTNSVPVTAASSGTTNIIYVSPPSTNWFGTSNRVVLLQRPTASGGFSYERLVVLNNTAGGGGITFTGATGAPVAVGDVLWQVSLSASIPVGITAGKEYAPPNALWSGPEVRPVYVDLTRNTNGAINVISGRYLSQ